MPKVIKNYIFHMKGHYLIPIYGKLHWVIDILNEFSWMIVVHTSWKNTLKRLSPKVILKLQINQYRRNCLTDNSLV